jgi:serine/threonine protein kinase
MAETERFEHFVIMRRSDDALWELGRGAMGVTYKAFDTNLRADVALKVISSQYLHSETARHRFLREARAAASLGHPNVATVFHLGNAEGKFFYAMEYVDGETVETRVRREGPFSLDLALRISRQVSRALVAADRQKLVHRDIKPSNIMLVHEDDEEQLLVKVIDFGLAKSLMSAEDQSLTVSSGGFVGTPHFASPEQLEGKVIDIRSDIYSMGATLWFMLVGHPPFQGSIASVIHQHLGQPLSPDVLVLFPHRVAALLVKMLAKKPEERFQSPADLKKELDEIRTDLKGAAPTVVYSGSTRAATAVSSTSSSGFATGQLVRNRYQILGHSQFDQTLFKAKDLQSNRIVGIRPLPLVVLSDTRRLDFVRQEVGRLRTVHHPNLLEVLGFESSDRMLFVISEWAKGFSLQELLRARGGLSWEETIRIARPFAKVLDFVSDRHMQTGRISLHKIFIEVPQISEEPTGLLRTPVSAWPPFIVKADALSLGKIENLAEPTQTVADPVELELPHAQQLALLIYELLGGVKPVTSTGLPGSRLNPLPALNAAANATLRLGATEPAAFQTATEFLTALETATMEHRDPVGAVVPSPINHGAYVHGTEFLSTPKTPTADNLPRTSPRLLKILIAAIAFFVAIAFAAVLVTNLVLRRPESVSQASQQGTISLSSKPEGAIIKWNGQEIGKTPLASYSLPKGRQILELNYPGYQPRPVEVTVTEGALTNVGVVGLVHEVGQIAMKSVPAGLAFEIVDPNQQVTSGNTPMTVENLPVGQYKVRMKRAGWPDYIETVNVQSNAVATVEHNFQGINVTLRSDPSGATISMGHTELGKTPLTISLPPEPVELVSHIGALAPVSREIVPDPNGTTVVEFKHDYGSVTISSDRTDAEVVIEGVNFGKPPIEGILPPGRHDIIVRAPGFSSQTKVADVQIGRRIAMDFNFNNAGGQTNSPSMTRPANTQRTARVTRQPQNLDRQPQNLDRQPQNLDNGRNEQISPTSYRTKDDYEHAKDAAFKRFDAEWDARKKALERAKDYYDYQADHSNGAARDQWEAKKEQTNRQMDELDDQKDAAKDVLTKKWND